MNTTTRRSGAALRLHPLALSLVEAGVLAGCGGGSDGSGALVGAARQNGGATASTGSTAAAAGTQVCFYEHVNYVGASMCLAADSAWVGSGWNDRISSVKVPAGFKVQLFADINYGGKSITLTADNANRVPSGFNDTASSMRITAPPAAAKVTLASVQFAPPELRAQLSSIGTAAMTRIGIPV